MPSRFPMYQVWRCPGCSKQYVDEVVTCPECSSLTREQFFGAIKLFEKIASEYPSVWDSVEPEAEEKP